MAVLRQQRSSCPYTDLKKHDYGGAAPGLRQKQILFVTVVKQRHSTCSDTALKKQDYGGAAAKTNLVCDGGNSTVPVLIQL